MRYLIAHLLSGELKEYHERVSKEIVDIFNKKDTNERIAPHFTLKAPFAASEFEIEEVKEVLQECCQNESAGTYTVDGFGHFGDRVIYLDAHPDKKTRSFLDALPNALSSLEWIEFGRYDYDVTLHATLARTGGMTEFTKIWQYLTEKKPTFDSDFSTISILTLKRGKWRKVETYSL